MRQEMVKHVCDLRTDDLNWPPKRRGGVCKYGAGGDKHQQLCPLSSGMNDGKGKGDGEMEMGKMINRRWYEDRGQQNECTERERKEREGERLRRGVVVAMIILLVVVAVAVVVLVVVFCHGMVRSGMCECGRFATIDCVPVTFNRYRWRYRWRFS